MESKVLSVKSKNELLIIDLIFEDDEKDIIVDQLENYLVYGNGNLEEINTTLCSVQLPTDLLDRVEKSFRYSSRMIRGRMTEDLCNGDDKLFASTLAIYNNAIGVIRYLKGRFEESLSYFKKALLNCEQLESAKINLCIAAVQTIEYQEISTFKTNFITN